MSSTNSPDDRSRDDERVAADGPPGEPSENERQNGNAPAGEQREAGEDAETDRDDDAGEPRRAPGTLWAALRRILGFAWPYRQRLIGALALVSGGSLVALAVPLGLRALVDAVFEQGNTRLLNRLTVGPRSSPNATTGGRG